MPLVSFLAGLLILAVIIHDAFEVMLLPRRVRRSLRLVRIFFRVTWALWSGLGKRLAPGDGRAQFFSLYGPLSMVVLLIVWAGGLIAGFGLIQWCLNPAIQDPSLANQLYFSGVTFFTLGYGDVTPHTRLSKVFAVFEAGTGLGFIAVVIGYLPVLYQLFTRREAQVIQLDARAGSPPSAVTLLCRHSSEAGRIALDRLLERWEEWCAEIIESHLSYPMLSYYRSQHDNESWISAIAAIMDTCALLLVGLKSSQGFQARMTFATARLAITELCRIFEISGRPLDRDRLPHAEFQRMQRVLSEADWIFEDENPESELVAFRATYEPFVKGLADYFVLLTPPCMAPEGALDNWQNSPRGRSAKQLIEAVPEKAD
ncbi:MAG: ion channel [Acidobacteriota bacterium]|nr:ion channel [Acidobacteriota bacterium]